MTTGYKSLLLKPVDVVFKRAGGGTAIPIKITGLRRAPAFGLDKGPRPEAGLAVTCQRFGAICHRRIATRLLQLLQGMIRTRGFPHRMKQVSRG